MAWVGAQPSRPAASCSGSPTHVHRRPHCHSSGELASWGTVPHGLRVLSGSASCQAGSILELLPRRLVPRGCLLPSLAARPSLPLPRDPSPHRGPLPPSRAPQPVGPGCTWPCGSPPEAPQGSFCRKGDSWKGMVLS